MRQFLFFILSLQVSENSKKTELKKPTWLFARTILNAPSRFLSLLQTLHPQRIFTVRILPTALLHIACIVAIEKAKRGVNPGGKLEILSFKNLEYNRLYVFVNYLAQPMQSCCHDLSAIHSIERPRSGRGFVCSQRWHRLERNSGAHLGAARQRPSGVHRNCKTVREGIHVSI